MNKSSLKTFAIWGRNELRKNVRIKLEILGIEEKKITEGDTHNNMVSINGFEYNKSQYDSLVKKYNDLGYNELVEEVAYTWFNRLTALAYMEINEYSDDKLIYSTTSKIEPDIIDNYMEADFFEELSQERKNMIHDLKDTHKLEKMYSILIEEKCHDLFKIMPFMFEKTSDYTELLFPSGLLLEDSFLVRLREEIKQSVEKIDGEKRVPVELIGWLYQFYNQDKRDVIFDSNMSNRKKIEKNDIPSATQIFTPKWIVKYMVENSLGKLAVESLGISEGLKKKWKYYITPKETLPSDGFPPFKETEVRDESLEKKEKLAIEDIKILDPAMGSGHMLTYSFDLLYDIYEDLGWSSKVAVLSILRNNIYGLEIDDRAGMLASFAIMMKAREKFRRLFRVLGRLEEDEKFDLNTLAIQESNGIGEQTVNLVQNEELRNLNELIEIFTDAKEYGSILKIDNRDESEYTEEIKRLELKFKEQGQMGLFGGTWNFEEDIILLNRLIHQGQIMSSKYDVVITNPPYMGNVRMSPNLKNYLQKNYKDVKSDLFAVFIKETHKWCRKGGRIALVTPYVWWFINSYEELRNFVLGNMSFDSLIQLEYNAFEGATIPVGTFTFKNSYNEKNMLTGIKLSEFRGIENQPIKTLEAIENPECGWRYQTNQKDFEKIPASPIAYWVSDRVKEIFSTSEKLEEKASAKPGLSTTNNNYFLKNWNEVSFLNIGLNMESRESAKKSECKWFPHNKGGEFKKWYGNNDYVVNWKNDGDEIREYTKGASGGRIVSVENYFQESISASAITSSMNSYRFYPKGALFDVNFRSIFIKDDSLQKYLLGFLNGKIVEYFLKILSPTLAMNKKDLDRIPFLYDDCSQYLVIIKERVKTNINIAKQEWDSRETSWDFMASPLINNEQLIMNNEDLNSSLILDNYSLKFAIEQYEAIWRKIFFQMHSNEEELNRMFIDIYNLQGEMDEKVDLKDITLLKKETTLEEIDKETLPSHGFCSEKKPSGNDLNEISKAEIKQGKRLVFNRSELIKQFLSYAVGCIMGRYSIDKPGLLIANSDDELTMSNEQLTIMGTDNETRHTIENPRFTPDAFGVIPVTGEKVFENDIVTRIGEFVKAVYGSETLNENLEFIATHLGIKKGESSKEAIRRYFIKDFYKDHLQRYKKRPIYWMVNSGKKEGFSALIYMHRYRNNTIGRVRTDYLNRYQEVLENILDSNSKRLEDEDVKPKDKKIIEREIKAINNQVEELKKFALDVKDITDQKISIDLDDGVKVNYAKFEKILKKI